MPRKAVPKPQPKELDWYGLRLLGYDDALPVTGDWLRDQLTIESFCFRIGHDPAEGGVGKFEHFKRFVDLLYNHPDRGSYKRFIWHQWAEEAIRAFCDNLEVTLAGSASSGKTSPAALWAVCNFIMDPTHVRVITLTTTIKEAKDRIWKEVVEFYQAIPDAPGNYLKSNNQIQGPSLSGQGYGTSSGIFLAAADKSNETSGVNSMIGTKVTKTGEPGRTAEDFLSSEYADLLNLGFDEEHVKELVLRLQEVAEDRLGKLIVVIDEATGVSIKLLDAYFSNLKPGNPGRVQIIVIGNPSSHFDTHGTMAEPDAGWDSIHVGSTSWTTKTGGICLHFDGTKNPKILTGDPRLVWMTSKEDNEVHAKKYGAESYEHYRMVRGFWAPEGATNSIYSESNFTQSGALENPDHKVAWGFQKPKKLCGFDPSFTSGGDRAVAHFGNLGYDAMGRMILESSEEVAILPDISNTDIPVPQQLVMRWKHECQKRGVPAENACFDASGGGISFAALVQTHWSKHVRSVSSGGKASEKPIPGEKTPDGKPIRGTDKFANRATELWVAALPFLRTGQLKNIPRELAKEICSRQKAKQRAVSNLNKIQIERKQDYKSREKHSPDCFIAGTMVETPRGPRPIEDLTEGDVVLTPFGASHIVKVHRTYTDELTRVVFGKGQELVGKGKHRVFVRKRGWVRLDAVTIGDKIESVRNRSRWKLLYELFSPTSPSGFKHLVDTVSPTVKKGLTERDCFILPSGVIPSGVSHVCAACAGLVSWAINIGRLGHVVSNVERSSTTRTEVFNLTLLRDNAYYANGVLVENCSDAFFLLIDEAKTRHGYKPNDKLIDQKRDHGDRDGEPRLTPWQILRNRARRLNAPRHLKKS